MKLSREFLGRRGGGPDRGRGGLDGLVGWWCFLCGRGMLTLCGLGDAGVLAQLECLLRWFEGSIWYLSGGRDFVTGSV